MIINIRGLSGSGKSTAVKKIMDLYTDCQVVLKNNKRPLAYKLTGYGNNPLIVIGAYDDSSHTAGCDTIPYNDQVFLLVRHYDSLGYDVLYEGMIHSMSATIPNTLHAEGRTVYGIVLEVPLDVVEKQRIQRAQNAGRTGEFTTATGMSNEKSLYSSYDKMLEAGVYAFKTTQADIINEFTKVVTSQPTRTQSDDYDRMELEYKYHAIKADRKEPEDKTNFNDLFSFG